MFLLVQSISKREPAFNALFDFNEAAVVGQVGHATSQFGTFRITFSDSYPRIFAQLFQAQGYTGTLAVELQHFNSDFVANVYDFARMLNAFPAISVMCSRPSTPPRSTNAP